MVTGWQNGSAMTSLPRLLQTLPTRTRWKTPHIPRMAHDQTLGKVMQHLLKDDTQVYKQFVENESFRRFVGDMVYAITSGGEGGRATA